MSQTAIICVFDTLIEDNKKGKRTEIGLSWQGTVAMSAIVISFRGHFTNQKYQSRFHESCNFHVFLHRNVSFRRVMILYIVFRLTEA